jgi:hypothetical protein
VRVFHAIEQHDQPLLALRVVGAIKDIFKGGRLPSRCNSNDALVIARVGEAVELRTVFETHHNAAAAGKLHDFFDTRVLPAFGDHDAIESATGFECFANGVNSRESVQGRKVYRRITKVESCVGLPDASMPASKGGPYKDYGS